MDTRRSALSGDPAKVADLVHDAVLANRFWVFTDMQMVNALQPRYAAVLSAENPPPIELG